MAQEASVLQSLAVFWQLLSLKQHANAASLGLLLPVPHHAPVMLLQAPVQHCERLLPSVWQQQALLLQQLYSALHLQHCNAAATGFALGSVAAMGPVCWASSLPRACLCMLAC